MAVTALGAKLTEAHRMAQLDISKAALREVMAAWRLLDPANVDATFPGYSRAVVSILTHRKSVSARTAAAYLREFRKAEGVAGNVEIALLEALAREQALTSLLVTGPVTIKTATRTGATPDQAADKALVQTLGAAIRLVQQGSRDTITETVQRDPAALGFARATDGNPCAFCAMLAGRGAVYKSAGTASFDAHDKCNCQPEAVYDLDSALPGRGDSFAKLYEDKAKGQKDALNAFRRAYERPHLHT